MDKKYTWAIEDIYKDESSWEKDYVKAEGLIDFSEFKGKLNEKPTLKKCLNKLDTVGRILEKLGLYAMLLHDFDTTNGKYDELFSKILRLETKFGSETSFITPEITSLKEEKLLELISDKDFSDYDYSLKCILKEKSHVLSTAEEKLLASASETLGAFNDIFSKISDADLPLKPFNYKGKKYELSHGTYGVYLNSEDGLLRRKCFKEYYKAFISLIHVISSTYINSVKKDVFLAKARNYSSALDKALSGEDVDVKVYKNLISSVNDNLPSLHRYMRIKKKALNLNKMHVYDVSVPIVGGAELKMDFDKAYDLVIKGLSPLGEDYVNLLKKAREERWISVYESKGKRSGAYSACVFDTHPYVLLNYQETTHDVFTIAHELGHSIHSYFSCKNQPYSKYGYKIFVAEVASTVNEVLLVKYLLKTAEDKKLKKYVLSYLAEMIRTTLFRQTQFAEFEEFSHSSCEKGIPLTKESLSEKYLEINKKYYGKAVISDKEIMYEWARVPHFYRAFYVYKYATGIISALSIADRILSEGKPAVEDYFKFLSSGDSDDPVSLLKLAGVDLTKKETFSGAFKIFEDALNEMEKL